jgi:hypothetical protein
VADEPDEPDAADEAADDAARGRAGLLGFPGTRLFSASSEGPAAQEGFRLDLDDEGVRLTDGSGDAVWSVDWEGIRSMRVLCRSAPEDATGTIFVEVEPQVGPVLRFDVPTGDPPAAGDVVEAYAREHGVATDDTGAADRPPVLPPTPARPVAEAPAWPGERTPVWVAAVVVTVTAAAVTVLLLAAGHVIRL